MHQHVSVKDGKVVKAKKKKNPNCSQFSSNWDVLKQELKKSNSTNIIKNEKVTQFSRTCSVTSKNQEKKISNINTKHSAKGKGIKPITKMKYDDKRTFSKRHENMNLNSQQEYEGSPIKKLKLKLKQSINEEDIWFDDVDLEDIVAAEENDAISLNITSFSTKNKRNSTAKKLVKQYSFGGLTKAVAMDCEMVGVGEGGRESVLARVSLVNQFGKCIYDKHVKPREEVTDYRTFVSGIRPSDLVNAEEFEVVQKEVADILEGRILVGHALWNDMKVLFLDHPKKCIRDTAKYKPFKTMTKGRSPALRFLSSKILGVQVQKGEHSSVQDAQAAMKLYTMHKREWEAEQPKIKLSKKAKKKRNAEAAIAAGSHLLTKKSD